MCMYADFDTIDTQDWGEWRECMHFHDYVLTEAQLVWIDHCIDEDIDPPIIALCTINSDHTPKNFSPQIRTLFFDSIDELPEDAATGSLAIDEDGRLYQRVHCGTTRSRRPVHCHASGLPAGFGHLQPSEARNRVAYRDFP